jgi:hypothetical protein
MSGVAQQHYASVAPPMEAAPRNRRRFAGSQPPRSLRAPRQSADAMANSARHPHSARQPLRDPAPRRSRRYPGAPHPPRSPERHEGRRDAARPSHSPGRSAGWRAHLRSRLGWRCTRAREPRAATARATPSRSSALIAFANRVMQAPIGSLLSARSRTRTSWPQVRRPIAAARPPIPAQPRPLACVHPPQSGTSSIHARQSHPVARHPASEAVAAGDRRDDQPRASAS